MPVEVAAHAGFCMGVRRAVEMAEAATGDGIPSGLEPIKSPEEAAGRRVLIRSHGVSPEVLEQLESAGSEILNLTCPFVEKLHRIVEESSQDGTAVILVGEKDHPEVRGTAGWAHGEVRIIAEAAEAESLPEMEKAVAVCQTTFPQARWEAILTVLKRKVRKLNSHCTICSATEIRQKEAAELAARSDAMIVVGGRNSANTHKLYDICKKFKVETRTVTERVSEAGGNAVAYILLFGILVFLLILVGKCATGQ